MRSHTLYTAILAFAAPSTIFVAGINVTTNDPNALSLAVKQVSNGVLSFYGGDEGGIGIFPDPYYWWESGVAWDTLVNYWYLTGDASHNAAAQAALVHQAGDSGDYMPANQTKSIMNDDQATWALAAMTAAERGFPVPSNETRWEDRASTAFDELALRWDAANCDGGLRWGIFTFNAGYQYKNALTQGMFFQLAARLARFTGNQTYVDWATRVFDWTRTTGLINEDFAVYDGTSNKDNCTEFNHILWSPNSAAFTYGAAVLANITSDGDWAVRTTKLLKNTLDTFFPNNILSETACEGANNCNVDQLVYPALTLRWLALVPVFQPGTIDSIYPALDASAVAAASRCDLVDGGEGATASAECRNRWSDDKEGKTGLGQQLGALEALQSRYVVVAQGGANASVVLRTVNETSAAGNGSGSGANGTATTSSGSAASETGANAAAGGSKASWGIVGAAALAMACLL